MRSRHPLTPRQFDATGEWIARQQLPDGAIPWSPGGRFDPWDHIHAAMGLTVSGRHGAARAALRYLKNTQEEEGGWVTMRRNGVPMSLAQETNHAAYLATGLWHLQCAKPSAAFLGEMWPTLERAIEFVLRLQEPSGAIAWAINSEGRIWHAPLLTGTSSIHGSLVCALRIAARLGYDRPQWREARDRVVRVLRSGRAAFENTDLPDPVGRASMDWYYPVLGGAVRGKEAKERLLGAENRSAYLTEGVGCRCVREHPWYTVAETCELIIALDACGLTNRAEEIIHWVHPLRSNDGGYCTGKTHPEGVVWPEERTAWTAATVLLAADALAGESPTSQFFRSLAGDDLPSTVTEPSRRRIGQRRRVGSSRRAVAAGSSGHKLNRLANT